MTRKTFLAVGAKHAWLYSDLPQAIKGEYLSALGFQQRGPLLPQYPIVVKDPSLRMVIITNV